MSDETIQKWMRAAEESQCQLARAKELLVSTEAQVASLIQQRDALSAGLASMANQRDQMHHRQPLVKAVELMTRFVRLSDSMATEWQQGDWRAVLSSVLHITGDFRAFLAEHAPKEEG